MWMSYDLTQAVHISGLRFVPNDDILSGVLCDSADTIYYYFPVVVVLKDAA